MSRSSVQVRAAAPRPPTGGHLVGLSALLRYTCPRHRRGTEEPGFAEELALLAGRGHLRGAPLVVLPRRGPGGARSGFRPGELPDPRLVDRPAGGELPVAHLALEALSGLHPPGKIRERAERA